MKALKTVIYALLVALAGCGGEEQSTPAPTPTPIASSARSVPEEPTATPTATPTPTPTPPPNPTLVTYIYQNIGICDALRSWQPLQTTIKTYPNSGNTEAIHYLFRYDGVFVIAGAGCESGCPLTATLQRSDIHGLVCTVTVTDGQLVGVTP
jgi:hypothetical protein